jgi:hypothetical protein
MFVRIACLDDDNATLRFVPEFGAVISAFLKPLDPYYDHDAPDYDQGAENEG